MTEKTDKSKIRYLGNPDPRETVIALKMYVKDALGAHERDMRLNKDRITRYYAGTEKISVLETAAQEKIYVALPFEELCRRMESRSRGNLIDLRENTGKTVLDMMIDKKLSLLFNTAALNDVLCDDNLLVFMDGYRKSSGGGHEKIAFLAGDVEQFDDGFLRLKDWKTFSPEWGMDDLSFGPYIRISSGDLAEKFRTAKKDGVKILDLTAQDETPPAPHQIKFSTAAAPLRRR